MGQLADHAGTHRLPVQRLGKRVVLGLEEELFLEDNAVVLHKDGSTTRYAHQVVRINDIAL